MLLIEWSRFHYRMQAGLEAKLFCVQNILVSYFDCGQVNFDCDPKEQIFVESTMQNKLRAQITCRLLKDGSSAQTYVIATSEKECFPLKAVIGSEQTKNMYNAVN